MLQYFTHTEFLSLLLFCCFIYMLSNTREGFQFSRIRLQRSLLRQETISVQYFENISSQIMSFHSYVKVYKQLQSTAALRCLVFFLFLSPAPLTHCADVDRKVIGRSKTILLPSKRLCISIHSFLVSSSTSFKPLLLHHFARLELRAVCLDQAQFGRSRCARLAVRSDPNIPSLLDFVWYPPILCLMHDYCIRYVTSTLLT